MDGTVENYMAQPGAPSFNKVRELYRAYIGPWLKFLLHPQVYLSNIFERLELDTSQSILRVVVNHMPSSGRLAYCTFLQPDKPPAAETLEKLTYLEDLSMELHKKDRVFLYSGFHVFIVN